MIREIPRGAVDVLQASLVAGQVVVMPVDQSVLPEDRTTSGRMVLTQFLQGKAELETGTHPWKPRHLFTVDLLRHSLAVLTGRDRDDGVGMRVIDVPGRHEGVQRRVDG